jgi:hypothetical protein
VAKQRLFGLGSPIPTGGKESLVKLLTPYLEGDLGVTECVMTFSGAVSRAAYPYSWMKQG